MAVSKCSKCGATLPQKKPVDQRDFLLKWAEEAKTRIGVAQAVRHLKGEVLDPRDAVLSECAICNGFHQDLDDDGEPHSCRTATCPFYNWFPYKRKGEVPIDDVKGELARLRKASSHKAGYDELCRHLRGERLSPKAAIRAFCFRCTNGFDDGTRCDEGYSHCSVWKYRPYQPPAEKDSMEMGDAP